MARQPGGLSRKALADDDSRTSAGRRMRGGLCDVRSLGGPGDILKRPHIAVRPTTWLQEIPWSVALDAPVHPAAPCLPSSLDTYSDISLVFLTNSASRSIPHLFARTRTDHRQSESS